MKLRHFFDHPAFVAANADAVRAARDTLPAAVRDRARVVFTAHSVPDRRGRRRGHARPTAGTATPGRSPRRPGWWPPSSALAEHDVVWQSRSGPPQVPWLEPDIVDHLDTLAAAGVPAVVVAPVGFVSDHVEVIWDLDTEARERAEELGIAFARAATAGPDPRFADMVVELVAEHTAAAAPRGLSADVPSAGCTVNGLPCAVDCCAPTRRPAGR